MGSPFENLNRKEIEFLMANMPKDAMKFYGYKPYSLTNEGYISEEKVMVADKSLIEKSDDFDKEIVDALESGENLQPRVRMMIKASESPIEIEKGDKKTAVAGIRGRTEDKEEESEGEDEPKGIKERKDTEFGSSGATKSETAESVEKADVSGGKICEHSSKTADELMVKHLMEGMSADDQRRMLASTGHNGQPIAPEADFNTMHVKSFDESVALDLIKSATAIEAEGIKKACSGLGKKKKEKKNDEEVAV